MKKIIDNTPVFVYNSACDSKENSFFSYKLIPMGA